MDWTRIGRFQQARVPQPSTEPRDEDAFFGTDAGFGIIELLVNSGLFDDVRFGTEVSTNRTNHSAGYSATVIPGAVSHVLDGSHGVARRVVEYRLVIEVLEGDVRVAWAELDRIRSAVTGVLLDDVGRAYGGFCIPWESKLQADTYSPSRVPGRTRSLRGSFAYLVNTVTGDGGL